MLHIEYALHLLSEKSYFLKVDTWGIWLVGYSWMTFLGDGFNCQRETLGSRIQLIIDLWFSHRKVRHANSQEILFNIKVRSDDLSQTLSLSLTGCLTINKLPGFLSTLMFSSVKWDKQTLQDYLEVKRDTGCKAFSPMPGTFKYSIHVSSYYPYKQIKHPWP